MKTESSLKQLLNSGARELGIELSDTQVDACFLYIQELKKWNRTINLSAIRDDRDIIVKHFLDSFTFAKGFTPEPGLMLLDMGSGAGFPALPLKIAFPDIKVTLIESVKKKASFLRHMIRTLEVTGAEVADVRTDMLPTDFSGRFGVVTARAFANMGKTLAESVRFLNPGGLLILSRGPEEGIEQGEIERLGYMLDRTEQVTLPYSDNRRAIWVFKKQG
ncbi:MAG TPA: 16S rRNA (guanine(527)-N(7))-methyltransferase RsmG [Nitrospirota bacterium]|nr:16S rRNA (guanine(527)-N(7))-methyltransferase RsmG [Nitrospirota bacterium]